MVPNVAAVKFGTLVLVRASVHEIDIRAIIFAKTIAVKNKGGINSRRPPPF